MRFVWKRKNKVFFSPVLKFSASWIFMQYLVFAVTVIRTERTQACTRAANQSLFCMSQPHIVDFVCQRYNAKNENMCSDGHPIYSWIAMQIRENINWNLSLNASTDYTNSPSSFVCICEKPLLICLLYLLRARACSGDENREKKKNSIALERNSKAKINVSDLRRRFFFPFLSLSLDGRSQRLDLEPF